MKSLSMWLSAVAALGLLAGTSAADTIAGGKVKSIEAEKKKVVLTDADGKDWNFKLSDEVVINRGGKETKSDLKAGDSIYLLYTKGLTGTTWTVRYILVQEGDTKDCVLSYGAFKGYDTDKKKLSFTDEDKKDRSFEVGDTKIRVKKKGGEFDEFKVDDIKIGDHVLAILEKNGDKTVLKSLVVEKK
jgi:hypothetical protein